MYFVDTDVTRKKKKRKVAAKHFTEGWVEFESKKVAKYVAATLNNTQVSTQKKSKFYDLMWNIKYLPRYRIQNYILVNSIKGQIVF